MAVGLSAPLPVVALEVPAAPAGRVSDFAGLLERGERAEIEETLAAYERESSSQVAVAIFRSLEGEELVDFTNRLFERWRLGQKGLDNGVLLAVYLEDRKARIEVGYGLEGRLTDALSRRILEAELIPRFRERDYAGGIRAASVAIVAATRGEYKAPARARERRAPALTFLIVLAVLLGLTLLRGLAGADSGITYDARGRRLHGRRRSGFGGFGGFGGGFGGGGFGGGGGFSGGGGMSGGGGASGSW